MAVSTAMTHNSRILVPLNGYHLFLTQLLGSAGALLHISSQGSRLIMPTLEGEREHSVSGPVY